MDHKLGLGTEGYSPLVLKKIVRQGGKAPSFADASDDLKELAELSVSPKHVQRLTERIGAEWEARRDAEVAAFKEGRLDRNCRQHHQVAAVMPDGGRLQMRGEGKGAGVHEPGWKEPKYACCLTLQSQVHAQDPQPEPPAKFLDPARVPKLVEELKSVRGAAVKRAEKKDAAKASAEKQAPLSRKKKKPKTGPAPLVRTAVASLAEIGEFGHQVAAEVHRRGLDLAERKACVGDGQRCNWSLWEEHLKPLGFVAILDFLHLLAYLYGAAQAAGGKGSLVAWRIYERWLRWAWAGEDEVLLKDMNKAAKKLGPAPANASDQAPQNVLAEALTYVSNNRDRMDYARYRRQGLPISSAPVESLIKQFNRRVKGTEKFWKKKGAEAVLQVRAAYLSQDERAEKNWSRPRPHLRAAGTGRLKNAA